MVDIAAPKPGERIYDPCFGMGGLLVTAAHRLQESQNVVAPGAWAELQANSIFGIEQQPDSCLLAAVRLMLAGIDMPRLECGDTLERDPSERRSSRGFDCILAQPPFGFRVERTVSSLYRIPSASGENLFLQHILNSLRPGGRAVVLVPEGMLFRGGSEEHLRKLLLNEYRVNAVVSLPAGALMPYAAVKTSILLFQKLPPRPAVWFVQEDTSAKWVKEQDASAAGYRMLVAALRASQQEDANPKLKREVEGITASEAAVFQNERSQLENDRRELAKQQAEFESKLAELHKLESDIHSTRELAVILQESRPDMEKTIDESREEIARTRSELAAIQTEQPVTDHGKQMLAERIAKLQLSIQDKEARINQYQKHLAIIDAKTRDSEKADSGLVLQVETAKSEILRAQKGLNDLAQRMTEVDQRLAEIHLGQQDWEAIQDLSTVARHFLSASMDQPRGGSPLPRAVVPISRLAGKGWELVYKEDAPDTLHDFVQRFAQVFPQAQTVKLKEIAEVIRGVGYQRVREDAPLRGSVGVRQVLKTVRVQDLPKEDQTEADTFPTVCPVAPKIMDAAVRPPKESDFLRPGDLLVSVSGTVGRVSIVGNFSGKTVASNGLAVIRCREAATAQYLAALLRTEPYQNWLAGNASGTYIQRLPTRALQHLTIPLPPLESQQRFSSEFRPGQSVDSVLSLVATGKEASSITDKVFQDTLLKKWASLTLDDVQYGSGLSHLVSQILAKSRSWSSLLNRESSGDPAAESLVAWFTALGEFAETQELQKENDRWAALQAWFNQFSDERGKFSSSFRRLRELRNRAAHSTSPGADASLLWRYSLLEKLRESLRLVWDDQTKSLVEATQVTGTVAPSILTVGVETELVFTVRNEGALPLRRIDLTTTPLESSSSRSSLSPMEEHQWTLKLRPQVAGKIDLAIKWSAQRMDRTAIPEQRISLAIEVQTLRQESLTHRLETSPYITGTSLNADDADLFFGRESMLSEIKRSLRTSGPSTVLILEGVRRVGKTSLLKQLFRPGLLPKWIPVYYNFQGASGAQDRHGVPTGTIFYEIAKEIVLACHAAGVEFDLPKIGRVAPALRKPELVEKLRKTLRPEFESDNAPNELFQILIDAIMPALGNRRVLLLLDEFDKVQAGIETGVTSPQVPDNFRNLFHAWPQISAILTGSQLMKRLRREYFNPLFGIGRPIPIGPLELEFARELVVKPVRGTLVYSDAARDWIVDACACQPFLIQHVCSRIFDICADAKELNVTTDTAKEAAEVWLKMDTHFDTVWRDDINDPRRQYVAWVIYELQNGPDPVTFDLIRQVLEKRGLYGPTALTGYLEDLRDLTVIRQEEKDRLHTYSIAIPLFVEWLRVRIDPAQYLTKAVNVDGGKL